MKMEEEYPAALTPKPNQTLVEHQELPSCISPDVVWTCFDCCCTTLLSELKTPFSADPPNWFPILELGNVS
jgi:hypothetical protein